MVMGLSPGMEFRRDALSPRRRRALRAGAFALALMAAACRAQGGANVGDIHQGYHPEKDTNVKPMNQGPDIRRRLEMHAMQAQRQLFASANAERKRQMTADSARLLQLAAELNAVVEKAAQGDLSLVAKAEAIEKLARAVKEKMKLTMSPP
jgi:hypothetical protein